MTDPTAPGPRTTADIERDLRGALDVLLDAWNAWKPGLRSPAIEPSRGGGVDLTLLAMSERREACEAIASWCLVVIDDRGLTNVAIDGTDMPQMVTFLQANADWISGHEAVDDLIAELAKEDDDGSIGWVARMQRILPRGRSDRVWIGECPDCRVDMWAYPAHLNLITCPECRREGTLRWWAGRILGEPDLLTIPQLVCYAGRYAIRVTDRTLRNLRNAGLIIPAGETTTGTSGVNKRVHTYNPWDVLRVLINREQAAA